MLPKLARLSNWLALPALLAGLALQAPAWGNDFVVNSTDNALDAKPGDGICETATNNHVCTLRGAVAEMMANPGGTITLPAGTFTLNSTGTATPNGALVLTGDVVIEGAGANSTILDGGSLSRLVVVQSGSPGAAAPTVKLANLTLRNGSTLAATAADDRDGGAVDVRAGKLTLSNAVIKSNNALQHGGGIHSSGSLELLNSTFDGNTAGNFGGAVSSSATLTVQRSAFYNNQAFEGGALTVAAGNVTLSNSTFTANNATDQGGAIYVTDGNVVAANLTITGNVADVLQGAGIDLSGGSLSLANSLVALNGDPNGNSANCDPSRAPVDAGHNIQFPATSCGSTIRVAAPQLGVLGDHGGATQTILPLSTSPAIDAIDDNSCSLTDQRGNTRVDGNADGHTACDIGAAEYVAPQSPKADLLVTVSDSADPVFGTGEITYTITVKNNGPATATGVVVTDVLPKNVTVVTLSNGCVAGAGAVRCTAGELAVGAQKQYSVAVRTTLQTAATSASRVPKLSVTDAAPITEGNSGTIQAKFTVKLSPAATQVVTVDYTTTGISATAGSDFVASSGKLVFQPGETSKTISVTVNGDTVSEPNETLSLDLSNPVRALLAPNSHALATIENDDTERSLSLSPSSIDIGFGETASLTITLDRPAPTGGLVVKLTSAPASLATLPTSVAVQAGQATANVTLTGRQTAGSLVLTASAEGFSSSQTTVNLRERTIGLAFDHSPVGVGRTVTGTLTLSLPAPSSGASITLVSDKNTIAGVPDSVLVGSGKTSASFTLTGIAIGDTTIRASAAGHSPASIGIGVTNNTITLGSNTVLVGRNLQSSATFALGARSSTPGPVDAVLTVKDDSIVAISESSSALGGASVTVKGINDRNSRTLYVHGLEEGKTEILVSAAGYASELISVEVTPSGFAFNTGRFSIKTSDTEKTISLGPRRLARGTLTSVESQPLRAGLSDVKVGVRTDSSTPGLMSADFAVVASGFDFGLIKFYPKLAGTIQATLVQPAGYATPSNASPLEIKVE